MPISKIVALSAEILILFSRLIYAVDSSCMIAYNDGGAPAVLQSLECTTAIQWVESFKKSTKDCDFASLQGHRQYQEDRVTCIHNIKLPLIGKGTKSDAKVDLLAIFDGHGGSEASEMAKQYLLGFFLVHVIANAIKNASNLENHNDLLNVVQGSRGHLIEIDDNSIHEIFKYSLLGAIRDIDRKFSLEAVENRYSSGSTASVALLLNNEELIVANVGDSKVILCAGSAEELTNDHHPDRDDERARIEQAGGYVLDWDVPRVNGILAVSRAIGDVSLKRYGVISEPELVGWLNITAKDRYLAVVSDGVFESLTPENVCQLVDDADVEENARAYDRIPFLPSFSMAYRVVKTALQKGSTDNLSAIVVPLALATDEVLVHKDEL
ncbi:probable protein phosphatase 2C 51 [Rutidosis leptorrhynchoides]|uniref:probable protein phosphatase 2C 51 n=1 Tax=Rutidosis leptorrhynchoides TaxID=125765 RepID=UPI003A98E271